MEPGCGKTSNNCRGQQKSRLFQGNINKANRTGRLREKRTGGNVSENEEPVGPLLDKPLVSQDGESLSKKKQYWTAKEDYGVEEKQKLSLLESQTCNQQNRLLG